MARAARVMGKRAGIGIGRPVKLMIKSEVPERFAGACTGVKYPCSYHCKKCFYEFFYAI